MSAIRSIVEAHARETTWHGVEKLISDLERHTGAASSPLQRTRTDDELDALLGSADIVAEMAGLVYGNVPPRARRLYAEVTARCDSPHDEVVAEEIRHALGRIKSEVCRLHPGAVCRGAVFLVVAHGASSAVDHATGLATLHALYEVEA